MPARQSQKTYRLGRALFIQYIFLPITRSRNPCRGEIYSDTGNIEFYSSSERCQRVRNVVPNEDCRERGLNFSQIAQILTARGKKISPQGVHILHQTALGKIRRRLELSATEIDRLIERQSRRRSNREVGDNSSNRYVARSSCGINGAQRGRCAAAQQCPPP
jgi:hypothetical protein